MNNNKITDIIDLLGSENIEHYSVVSKEKEHKIQVISDHKCRDILRQIGVIPFGEDLPEAFTGEFVKIIIFRFPSYQ